MPAFIKNLTVDCDDALVVARFWAAALGSDVDEDSTPERAYVEAAGEELAAAAPFRKDLIEQE